MKIKKDITELNSISNDFLQSKFNLTKQSKAKLKAEEDHLTLTMISIDVIIIY